RFSFSDCGLKCTLTVLPPPTLVAFCCLASHLISTSCACVTIPVPRSGQLDRERAVGELHLFDRQNAVLRVQRGRLHLDWEAIGQAIADARLATDRTSLVVHQNDAVGLDPTTDAAGAGDEPDPEVLIRGHPALQREVR